jgi:hypothetical protein
LAQQAEPVAQAMLAALTRGSSVWIADNQHFGDQSAELLYSAMQGKTRIEPIADPQLIGVYQVHVPVAATQP